MLAYAIAAALLVQPLHQQPAQPVAPQSERIGAWEIRISVDPVTDDVNIGAYLGTPADQVVIACGKGYPDSTVAVWRSSRTFRETALRTSDGFPVSRVRVGNITYRFDQDTPVETQTRVRENYRTDFDLADVLTITGRIGSSTRLVLRDRLDTSHTVVFDLVPADTLRALQRLDAVCGTKMSEPTDALA